MTEKKKQRAVRWQGLLLSLCVLAGGLSGCAASKAEPSSSLPLAGETGTSSEDQADGTVTPSSSPDEESAPQTEPEEPNIGLFQEGYQKAKAKMEKMTLKEKVGQVFLFICPGEKESALQIVKDYQPGGFCLMGNTFKDRSEAQVKEILQAYQSASKLPILYTTDEEGGTVLRVSRNPQLAPKQYRSPQQVYKAGGMEAVRKDTLEKSAMLKNLGIQMNLAPVADVSTNASDFIYARSFGKSAKETADFIDVSVKAYEEAGMGCALKHFPGYGSNADTHTGQAVDKRTKESFQKSDFIPFTVGIKLGAPAVLINHNIVESMDAKNPASLSPEVHRVLREELHFTGLIMTDDLAMEAIPKFTGGKSPAVAAFLAGNDFLLSGNAQADFEALLQAVLSGEITEARLDESVLRILAYKAQAGII